MIDQPISDEEDGGWTSSTVYEQVTKDLTRLYLSDSINSFLQSKQTQSGLLDILLVWVTENPEPGYKQGMHELLAVLYLVVVRCAAVLLAPVVPPLPDG